MIAIPQLFHRVSIQPPRSANGLQVFGLRIESPGALHYETLDEALNRHDLEVTEINEGGSVPTLKVLNKSEVRIFLMAGEQLIGAKQNRVLNTSMMVEGKTETAIPVSCVEQGRWGYRSAKFGSHGTSSHSKLRHKMTRSVSESYLTCAAPRSDQGEVWSEVHRKLDAMGSTSMSAELEQTYMDSQVRLDSVLLDLPAPEGCNGAVFVLHGKIAGLDVFDQAETLAKLWPKLLRGYAIDALEQTPATADERSATDIEAWLKKIDRVKPKPFPSPGLGEDVRFNGADIVGAGLVVEATPVHVQMFAETRA
jgi:ARG and Rhodanese-Phosphatase-superfamily-associated Protein domain